MYRPMWRRPVWRTIVLGLAFALVVVATLSDLVLAAQGHFSRPWRELALRAALAISLGLLFADGLRRDGLWLPSAP